MKSISRRSFMEGALIAGGAAAIGMLSGCSAGKPAGEAAGSQQAAAGVPTRDEIVIPHTASANVASFDQCTFDVEEPAPLAAPEAWDMEADVVVVGTGGGLAGAAYAAQNGCSVIAVEVASTYGGTSKAACLYYFATGTRCQTEAGIPDITDALRAMTLANYPVGDKYPKHVDNCLQGMKDLVAWSEEYGMEWEPGWIDGEQKVAMCVAPKGSQEGWNSYRMMTITEDFYNKVFTDNGGEYLFNTAITGLVEDGGRIVGIQATPKDGEPVLIKANKGIILAAGGMANNIAMLKRYCPDGFARCMVSNAGTNDNGDAIRLGLGAGAQLDGFNNHGHFDGGIEGVDWNHMLYAADIQIARQPWLQIDTQGKRMVYSIEEYESYGGMIQAMPESKVFSFFDANWETACENFVLPMCRNLTKPDMPNQERWGGLLDNDYRNGVRAAIEEGRIKQGNTPEELAEAMGIAPEYVVNAFKEWNDMVASGDGSAYGYKPEWLFPLDTPPFYGQALGAMMYSTRVGLSIDENQQVVATNGKVIPGLYAAGATSGRPAFCVCGDVGYAAVSAFNAARHIVENA